MVLLGIAAGSILSMPLTGLAISRYGSKRPTAWAGYAFCLSLLPIAFAGNAWTLAAAMLFYGATSGAMDVAMNAQGVTVEKLHSSSVLSSFHAMFSFGGMLGAALGGVIASAPVPVTTHFFAGSVLFALALAVVAPLMVDAAHEETAPDPPKLRWPTRTVFRIGLIAFFILLCEGAMADWTAIYLRDFLHANPARAAAGYAIFSGTMALGRLAGDWLTDHLGAFRIVRWGSLLAAAGLAISLSVPNLALSLCGFAAVGLGLAAIIPNVFGAGGRAEGMAPGAGIAAVTTTGYFGFLMGPPLIGWIAEVTGLRIALYTLAGMSLAASFLAEAVRESRRSSVQERTAVPELHM
jgi:MFS family permease